MLHELCQLFPFHAISDEEFSSILSGVDGNKRILEITLVNLTYLAAMSINSVTLKIILIQITTPIMIYMSIVDIMMTIQTKI